MSFCGGGGVGILYWFGEVQFFLTQLVPNLLYINRLHDMFVIITIYINNEYFCPVKLHFVLKIHIFTSKYTFLPQNTHFYLKIHKIHIFVFGKYTFLPQNTHFLLGQYTFLENFQILSGKYARVERSHLMIQILIIKTKPFYSKPFPCKVYGNLVICTLALSCYCYLV